jgi:hypothetical protein
LDSAAEVEHLVRNLLRQSKAWGRFPTPVDEIAVHSKLVIERRLDLRTADPGFVSKNFGFLSSALDKILGLIDFRQRTIYLDQTMPENRKNFVKLHEVGHGVIPWQNLSLGYGDDEKTIAPDVAEQFEQEANFFASAALFQLELFDRELNKLPLAFGSVRALSQRFGASIHATARRYVERCPKRCALLVLEKPADGLERFQVGVRNCFESPGFLEDFGRLGIPGVCDLRFGFVEDIRRRRRLHENGHMTLPTLHQPELELDYHFFNNGYHSFVLMFPNGETIRSRVKIVDSLSVS